MQLQTSISITYIIQSGPHEAKNTYPKEHVGVSSLIYFSTLASVFIKEFTLISDPSNADLIVYATNEESDIQNYICGCFWFKKPHLS